ncbi:MAG TPA: GreA/GreB family elongation factor [Candidatus Eisenbacteria bacterium]|nr:GreA/GreB family elongation factor [Candidatus Eisenbacteria bacterium]
MQKAIIFTKKGYEDKQKEYDALLASRPDAVADLAKARAMGDLSENGYYKSARMKLSQVDRDLRQLKYILRFGKVQESSNNGIVDVGSVVTITTGTITKTYEIVGTYEANPSKGKLSSSSPLGRVLLGKKVGDTAILAIGENKTIYDITAIL